MPGAMTTETFAPNGDVVGLTDRSRLPRLGKIRLGIRDEARGFPRALDFFVVPEVVQSVYGPKPRELDVVFPSDDVGRVAGVAWKQYTSTRGKVCWGDGERAVRTVDADRIDVRVPHGQSEWDAAIVKADSKHVERAEIPCPAKECSFAVRNLCKPVLNLMLLLPKVPGIGVWQLDSGSINSILDVRGGIELVMQLSGGKLAGIPLKLRLEPMEVISPDDQKKKIVHTLKLISPATLGKVLMAGERNLRELLMADEGSGRSVGLPALGVGREVPPPHEPEEDLYPLEIMTMPTASPRTGASSSLAPAGVAQSAPDDTAPEKERGRSTTEVAGSTPAPRSDTDLQARVAQLQAELEITPQDRKTWEHLYAGRTADLVKFLEGQLTKRKAKA